MSRIQATNGLVSGIDIAGTVEQLMKIQARPRDLLISRGKILQQQQVAVTELTALTIGVQLASRNLAKVSLFDAKSVTSSSPGLLSATVASGATPASGTYRFTPVRQATAQHILSTGFASTTEPVGAGELTLQYGGYVDTSVELSELNGGAGISRGKIRVTDRSGTSATVDLRFAKTIDDVVTAINSADDIQVTASVQGDRLKLVDRTGSTTSNLRVQELSGGSTASDLGLASINVAADSATGGDILKLYNSAQLDRLNDGNGLSIRDEVADLNVTLRDGTSLAIDLHQKARAATFATATTTGDADAQIKLTAKTTGAALDNVRIQFVDDAGVTQGSETVDYDDTDPEAITLTVHIDAGNTNADDVIDAINNDTAASAKFAAARATGSDGTGVVTEQDTGVTSGGAALTVKNEQTLGELLATINGIDPNRLQAEISGDGDRLVLTDLTNDYGGTFAVTSTTGGTLAHDLGLTGTAVGGTLTGGRLQGGLKSSLLRSFSGGQGLGTLGDLDITDRSGATATVSLANAETLDDVIATINGSGLGVEARVNTSRNGIEVVDTTGAITSNFIIADGDAANSATKLNIATSSTNTSVNSGTFHRQYIAENTLLSSLNGGKGVGQGSFFISDSTGSTTVIRIDDDIKTVGDLLDSINALTIGVEAKLSATGDGIDVLDTASGTSLPSIRDVGSGTAAKDLHLTGSAVTETIDNVSRKVIHGSQTLKVTVSATDKLSDVVTKINSLSSNFTASILSDGSGQTPHRLSIQGNIIGSAGNLLVDSSYGVKFEELTHAYDALLQLGADANGSGGVLVESSSNTFENAVAGINLTIMGASTNTVTVTASQSDSSVVSNVQLFVDQYNKLRDKIDTVTAFNETDQTTGILFGSNEALRIESEFSSLVSGRFFGVGDIKSLKELGLDLNDAGKMTFDSTKLKAKFASDPAAVKKFFTEDKLGFADKVDDLMEDFSGIKKSLLVNRAETLQRRIDVYNDKIATWDVRLSRAKEAMLKKFYNLETALGKLQNNLTAISGIQAIPPLGST